MFCYISESTTMDLNDLLGMENYPSELMPDLPDDFPVSFTCSKCRSTYPNLFEIINFLACLIS